MNTLPTSLPSVVIELCENKLTGRPDDFYGRVVNVASVTEEALIERVVHSGSDIHPAILRASYELLKNKALDGIRRGEIVDFGLGRIALDVEGVFVGSHAAWNPSEHKLTARLTPSKELREALKQTPVHIFGKAPNAHVINSVTDVSTGKVNELLTPGGIVNIKGRMIKITGSLPEIGLWLADHATGEKTLVPPTAIGINTPTAITFVTPAAIPPGDYELSIVTQYSGKDPLTTPSTITLSYVLAID